MIGSPGNNVMKTPLIYCYRMKEACYLCNVRQLQVTRSYSLKSSQGRVESADTWIILK